MPKLPRDVVGPTLTCTPLAGRLRHENRVARLARIFRPYAGRVLAAVSRAGRVLVTAEGKPEAIMMPTSAATFVRDLEMLDCVALTQALEAIRTDSVANGTDVLTMAAIDADRHGQSRFARWGRTDVLTMAAIDAEVAVARKARPRPP
jgi:hypothetical protein